MRIKGLKFAGLAVVVVAGSLAGAGTAGATVVAKFGSGNATARYWTPRRMARARPLDVVRGDSGTELKRAPKPPPFDSFQVPDPTTPPLTTHGKVFGFLRGFGGFECSGTVVDTPTRSVVVTAGHCVYEPRTDVAARNLAFVPSYDHRARPFGKWTASAARSTQAWMHSENYDYDYATLTMRPLNGALIEDVVGGRTLATDTPRQQVYNAYGYPANKGNAQLMWACTGPYAGDDPRPIPGGPPPIGMGCDMTEGASGGGWVNDLGQLVSVTSFGYQARKGFLYGPYLTAKAARLIARS